VPLQQLLVQLLAARLDAFHHRVQRIDHRRQRAAPAPAAP
jgi:hypothetical protein